MEAQFDTVASDYDAQLGKGLTLTGENKEFFAEQRVLWVRKRLQEITLAPRRILDFGCGTGTATPFLFQHLGIESLIGSDLSTESLQVAREAWAGQYRAEFIRTGEEPAEAVDLAWCNGVFHHIPLEEREEAMSRVFRAIRPGGIFAFWENNPWNPLMRYSMSRVPFDADAIMVWPREARRLLRAGGFQTLSTDTRFYFPKVLAPLRRLEPCLARLPFGAQYLVLSRKPA